MKKIKLISLLGFYTICYNMYVLLYHFLLHLYYLLCLVIFGIFSVILISILIPNLWSDFCNPFVLQIYFTKNNPLWTDTQIFWKCKWNFVTVTTTVNLPQPNLSCVILLCVCFSTHFNEDGNLMIYTRVFASWLKIYLSLMNKMMGTVTSKMTPMNFWW